MNNEYSELVKEIISIASYFDSIDEEASREFNILLAAMMMMYGDIKKEG